MNDVKRNIAFIIELESSLKYLKKGLAEVQNISPKNDFYHAPLLYLSSGFERLFKSILSLNFKEKNKRFPNYRELLNGNNGHDIQYLKSEFEKISVIPERKYLESDYDIITKDQIINSICEILSNYAKKARYFNLDIILGNEQEYDAQKEWERLETTLLTEKYGEDNYLKMIADHNKLEEIYKVSNKLVVKKIELFIRAITRQFIFGNFSRESNKFISIISEFSQLEDEEIGTINYNSI